ncbi:hypothetical protein Q2417_28080, partial [Escherichia coli]|nr:hypothetical protein [Escherichia coli]
VSTCDEAMRCPPRRVAVGQGRIGAANSSARFGSAVLRVAGACAAGVELTAGGNRPEEKGDALRPFGFAGSGAGMGRAGSAVLGASLR